MAAPSAGLTASSSYSNGAKPSAMPMVGSGWWNGLGSADLNALIDGLIASNPDIAAASLRVLQSELELGNIRSQRLPTATASASSTGTAAAGPAGDRSTDATGDLAAGVRWEADLWGRIAREGDRAAALLLATSYDREALANSLIANVIRAYISVTFDRREIVATRRIIDSRRTSLAITQDRFGLGVDGTTAGTVKSAEENLAAARAELPRLELSLIENVNALDALSGGVPRSRISVSASLPRNLPPLNATTGTPVQLLDRRPDIQAAAARLAAANANIGVSVADRFPTLTLNGSLRSGGGGLGDILDIDNVIASLTAELLLTVFDGGRGSRLVAIRKAEAEELAHSYVSTVLAAIREVEDGLSGERLLAERARLLTVRLSAARQATRIASDRYRDGTGTYLTLLDSSRSEANAETAYLNVERARWINRVDLMLALGGRWSAPSIAGGPA
ncbi:MAG: efflux transporter outer membrane subunit [Rhodobacter sp.]|nr:efflux transporter outer membrane subunit [Rhodobacter sp.]